MILTTLLELLGNLTRGATRQDCYVRYVDAQGSNLFAPPSPGLELTFIKQANKSLPCETLIKTHVKPVEAPDGVYIKKEPRLQRGSFFSAIGRLDYFIRTIFMVWSKFFVFRR